MHILPKPNYHKYSLSFFDLRNPKKSKIKNYSLQQEMIFLLLSILFEFLYLLILCKVVCSFGRTS